MLLAAAALLLCGTARPATAHLAIRLDLLAPTNGQRVDPPVDVELVARPMLLGVPQTTFTLRLDGRPLDPATGRQAATPVATPIRVNQTKRIRLGSLPAGQHTLEVSYRPDRDAPVASSRVTFTVTPHRTPPAVWLAVGLATSLLGLVAAGLLARRRVVTPSRANAHPSPNSAEAARTHLHSHVARPDLDRRRCPGGVSRRPPLTCCAGFGWVRWHGSAALLATCTGQHHRSADAPFTALQPASEQLPPLSSNRLKIR